MNRPRLATVALLAAMALTGCSSPTAIPAEVAPPAPATLAATADSMGCTGYVQSSDFAPFATEYGKCTFENTSVSAYAFGTSEDYAAWLESISAFGITESQLIVVGQFVFGPDDQTKTAALRAAATAP